MLGDIAVGHTWGADVCFLIAVILGGLAALLVIVRVPARGEVTREYVWGPMLGWAAVAVVALGFLIL